MLVLVLVQAAAAAAAKGAAAGAAAARAGSTSPHRYQCGELWPVFAIQKGTRVLVSLWDSLMFGRVLKSTTIF